jgi:DNA-binding MarR family transcriptional regulator
VAADDAARVAAHLDVIHQELRKAAWAAAREHPVALTAPQLAALQLLVDDLRAGSPGPSLKELSARMGLAHSTVSGIVSRLEGRGLVRRATRPEDRRTTRIELTEPVKRWVRNDLVATRLRPLEAALARATDSERAEIRRALATLERLLTSPDA